MSAFLTVCCPNFTVMRATDQLLQRAVRVVSMPIFRLYIVYQAIRSSPQRICSRVRCLRGGEEKGGWWCLRGGEGKGGWCLRGGEGKGGEGV